MAQVDTFHEYVIRRLDRWGNEFALHRDCEYLGHQSKNMLQVLIEHRGEMPARATGYKPQEVDQDALQIERLVAELALSDVRMACCLRGYYCGQGRRKVERYETARDLVKRAEEGAHPPGLRQYMDYVRRGEDAIKFMLRGIAIAA